MKDRFRDILFMVIGELPAAALLAYLGYLAVIMHSRHHLMVDYTLIFDSWWHFHRCLAEGVMSQWNPFSLLGRIAVQWNYVPVSVIYSPFLIFSELTLEKFHCMHIIGTFLSFSVVYFIGRLLKYSRFYSMLPVALLAASGYRYWASCMHFSTFLLFYPLAIVFLIFTLEEKSRVAVFKWLMFITFFALALTGARLESMIYAVVFLMLIFIVRGVFLSGVGSLIFILALVGWQMPYLVNSTTESHRIFFGLDLQGLTDPVFLKFVFASLARQSFLIMACLNLVVAGIFRSKGVTPLKDIPAWGVFLLVIDELLLARLISLAAPIAGADIAFSWYSLAAIFLLTVSWFLVAKERARGGSFAFLAAVFAGFYVAEYSWHIWPVNRNMHSFFMPAVFASFIPFGAVNLMMKKKAWIMVPLAIFHFMGETGIFFSHGIFGMPWLPPRAALMEVPFQIILMLETVEFFIVGISAIVAKLNEKTTRFIPAVVATACVIITFLSLRPVLMPQNAKKGVYLEEFPFGVTTVERSRAGLEVNRIAREAMDKALIVRELGERLNPQKRVRVEDSVLNFAEMFYKFMPAYSRALNTAPVYSSEIPENMKSMFAVASEERKDAFRVPHPEMNPLYIIYKKKESRGKGKIRNDVHDYINMVTIFPHEGNGSLMKEIMAEEGSATPRAFLSREVVKFSDMGGEYAYLKDVLSRGALLKDKITTSDGNFQLKKETIDRKTFLKYNLKFVKDTPEHVIIRVNTKESAYLALMDSWSKGWKAYVDGREAPVYRGYMGTRFVGIADGEHIVEFKYTVPGLMPSLIISALAWFLIVILLIFAIFKPVGNTRLL